MQVKALHKLLIFGILGLILISCEPETDPNQDPRLDWVGFWTVNETSGEFAPQTYTIQMSLGSGDLLVVQGLYAQGNMFALDAAVSRRNFTLPAQSANGFNVSGSGTANEGITEMNLNFTINDGSGADNVTAILKKQ